MSKELLLLISSYHNHNFLCFAQEYDGVPQNLDTYFHRLLEEDLIGEHLQILPENKHLTKTVNILIKVLPFGLKFVSLPTFLQVKYLDLLDTFSVFCSFEKQERLERYIELGENFIKVQAELYRYLCSLLPLMLILLSFQNDQ